MIQNIGRNTRCDVYTDDYLQWIRDNKLPLPTGDPLAHKPLLSVPSSSNCDESTASLTKANSNIKEYKKQPLNAKANCITDTEVLEGLKQQKEEKEAKERKKSRQQLEQEKRRQERERKEKQEKEEETRVREKERR